MQLSDLLSSTKIAEIRAIQTTQSDADRYAPSLSAQAISAIYDAAIAENCSLTSTQWEQLNTQNAFICLHKGEVSILTPMWHKAFASHIYNCVSHNETVIWLRDNYATSVTRQNIASIYKTLTTPQCNIDVDYKPTFGEKRSHRINAERERLFADMSAYNAYKKPGKRGFNMSFDQQRAEMRTEYYIKELKGTIYEARQILAACY